MPKDAGSPPDPYATAQAQGAANNDTARLNATLNRGNTYTPWGNVVNRQGDPDWNEQEYARRRASWDAAGGEQVPEIIRDSSRVAYNEAGQVYDRDTGALLTPSGTDASWKVTDGSTRIWDEQAVRADIASSNPYRDQWTTTINLSPEQQGIYDAQTRTTLTTSKAAQEAAQRLRGYLGTNLDTSKLFGLATPPTMETLGNQDYAAQRDQVTQSILDRLAPMQARDQEAQNARLAAQGIGLGSEAYSAAEADRMRGVNDARLAAVIAGGQEQSRLFGIDVTRMQANNEARLTGAQSQNATRAQQLAELLQLRAQPINEVAALFGLGNGITVPSAQSLTPTASGSVDIAGGINSNYQQRAAQAAAGNQAAAAGIATVASAAIAI